MNQHHSVLSVNLEWSSSHMNRTINSTTSFFRKVPKTVILAIFWHVWPKSAKMRNFIKNPAVLFFTLIVPQLHAEFQKNRWSGFRDQFVTDARTDARTHEQRWNHRTGRFRWFNYSNVCSMWIRVPCILLNFVSIFIIYSQPKVINISIQIMGSIKVWFSCKNTTQFNIS